MTAPMVKGALAVIALVASFRAAGQDQRTEVLCGNLYGARETAIRLLQEGWPVARIIQEALDRPEWRQASMTEQKLLLDVLEEAIAEPTKPSSEVIRECVRKAERAHE